MNFTLFTTIFFVFTFEVCKCKPQEEFTLELDATKFDDEATTDRPKGFFDLTPEEKEKLDQFRAYVSPNLSAPYMHKDDYLLRFLKQTKFNTTLAQNLMMDMLQWRKAENIDRLLEEDFPEFETDYNIFLEGCDLKERPVISVPFGTWDIRRAALAGLSNKLGRFMDKIFEDATHFLRSVNEIGVEIYEATLILDLEGFDMKTHACPKCIQLYLYFFKSLKTHYPGLVVQIYFINTPQIANLIWDIYKEVFTPELRAITTIYGLNSNSWKDKLVKEIPSTTLPRKYGGTRETTALEFFYIRSGSQLVSALNDVGAVHITGRCEQDLKMYDTLVRQINVVVKQVEKRSKASQFDWGCPNQF